MYNKITLFQPRMEEGKGSVMLWGCISFKGQVHLVRVQGIINSMKHQEILNENLGSQWIFKDSNLKNMYKSSPKWLTESSFCYGKISHLTWNSLMKNCGVGWSVKCMDEPKKEQQQKNLITVYYNLLNGIKLICPPPPPFLIQVLHNI